MSRREIARYSPARRGITQLEGRHLFRWGILSLGIILLVGGTWTLSGCGILAGKAAETALGSVRDLEIQPGQVTLLVGQTQQFRAVATKVLGSERTAVPSWSVEGEIGFINQQGLFTATNPGTGKVRGEIKTGAGTAQVVGRANITVALHPEAPRIVEASLEPTEGTSQTVITLRARVEDPQGLADVLEVKAREPLTGIETHLFDDGIHGSDPKAGDGVFTGQLPVPPGFQPGQQIRIGIFATDFNNAVSSWWWGTFNVK